jgi:hypothetical protein
MGRDKYMLTDEMPEARPAAIDTALKGLGLER